MNNVIMRAVTVTSSYRPLVAGQMIATAVVSCPPANAAPVFFKGDDRSDVPWVPGEWHQFKGVDLGGILVKGTDGDTVTVVGGSW